MISFERSEIREELLTLEDAALLADPNGQLTQGTVSRLRRLARTDPRVISLFEYLEALADEADLPDTSDRLDVGLKCLADVERLLQADGWQHPAEILDPSGEIGVNYSGLVKLAQAWARQAGESGRHRAVGRKLERAWCEEKARNQPVEDFVARLCQVEPEEAERLLRQAGLRYRARRRQVTAPAPRRQAPSRRAKLCRERG